MRRLSLLVATLVSLALPATANEAAKPFSLPPLPYAYEALEPVIGAETMRLHHTRHHQAQVDGLNAQVAHFPELAAMSVEQILAKISSYPAAVRGNAGGHFNHSLYWQVMAPKGKGGAPSEALSQAIAKTYGSMDGLRDAFAKESSTLFGSGWVWLIVTNEAALALTTTPNQDNPLMDVAAKRGTPILGNDLWEHAYYLGYQNRRADYIKAWWELVNWQEVSRRYGEAIKTSH